MYINRYFQKVMSNSLLRNFTKLFVGTAAAKIIGFLAMPFIARLYSPEEFGVFSVFLALTSIIAPLLALRFVDAIPIPKSASRAVTLLSISIVLILFNASLLLVVAVMLLPHVAELYDFIDIYFILAAFCVVIALALYEVLSLWAVRKRNYGVIARTQITQALVGAVSKLVLGYFIIPMGLFYGQIIQHVTGISFLLRTNDGPFRNYIFRLSPLLLFFTCKKYLQYPKFRLPSQALLVITQALPVLVVSKMYSEAEAGQLGLAFSVVTAPVMMVVGNVRKLYYGEAANLGSGRPQELKVFTLNVMMKLIALGFPGCLCVYFFSETTFVLIFGENWRLAGQMASFYSFFLFGVFVVGAFSDLLNIFGKQKSYLWINAARFIICCFTFICASMYMLSPLVTVLTYSIAMMIMYFGTFIYFIYIINNKILTFKG